MSETLTQLPEGTLKRCQVAILRDPNINERDRYAVQAVLNEPGLPFQKYEIIKIGQHKNEILPKRKRETIVTSVGRGSYSLEGGMAFAGRRDNSLGRMTSEFPLIQDCLKIDISFVSVAPV